MSAISQLEAYVWNNCIIQIPCENEDEVDRWNNDHYWRMTERIKVRAIPASEYQLVQRALEEWQGIEDTFLESVQMDREHFLQLANEAHMGAIQKQMNPHFRFIGTLATGVVVNADTWNLFAWFLPQAVNQDLIKQCYRVGKMVTAVFLMETISKYDDTDRYVRIPSWDTMMNRLDSTWRFVHNTGSE